MLLDDFCPPALLYIAFSITHIIIDSIKGLYNTALIKFLVMIVFCIILNLLCNMGLVILAWFIVFIPFIMMTIVSSILLFTFGLSPSSGKLNYNIEYPQEHSINHNNTSQERLKGDEQLYHRRKQPMNYNTYPHGSYGHHIHLDKNYYQRHTIIIKNNQEPSAAGTSAADTGAADTGAAGTSAAGTSAADTGAAGTSEAGTSAAGTSAAGTSAAGTSAADTSEAGTSAAVN